MKPKIIQWGMIGVGDVTHVKSAPSFNKLPNSKLLAVASRRAEKAETYAKENNIDRWYADPSDLIKDPDIDIIYIATPPSSHKQYALEIIAAGKHVYIEKPMALNFEECEEINTAADEGGVNVFVAYYRRALDYFLKIKEILDSGRLGNILTVHMDQHFRIRNEDYDKKNPPWRIIPEISGGGYFHDVGCHALDILFFLLGDPQEITGSAWNTAGIYEADDTVAAILRLDVNTLVTANWSFVVPEELTKDRVVITSDKGKLAFSIFSFEDIEFELDGEIENLRIERPEHIQMPLISTINEELRGEGKCPSSGESAALCTWVMDVIVEG